MLKKGKFIVIEGTDGSGKGEQTKRLVERLMAGNYPVSTFDFPRYGQPSAYFVERYLNGDFGSATDVTPKRASLFYAMDRFGASPDIKKALGDGNIVISNRYVASNLGHQGSKFDYEEEREEYFKWNMDLEFGINGIPFPDLNIILHVPPEVAQELVDKKSARKYLKGEKKRDIHEADLNHLQRTERTYLELIKLFPGSFTLVECFEGGKLLSIDEIHDRVWNIVKPLL